MFDFHAIPLKAIKIHGKKIATRSDGIVCYCSKRRKRKPPVSDRFKEIRDLINDVHGDLLPYFF